ncbi:MAG: PEP-CTERM sorting domain-containing protein [Acetobacteraceae bacterium]|nr:PEP-CTERM sorting domain-containing protein [Acetobacteraceae bacterium]
MPDLKRAFAIGLGVVLVSLVAVSTQAVAAVQLVTNGSFQQGNPTASYLIAGSLPGWSTTSSYSFLVLPGQATVNMGNGTKLYTFPTTSPDGGDFLVQDGGYGIGTLSQTLVGLVVGQAYTVSFFQASGQQSGYTGTTTEQWLVSFGNQSQESTLMTTPQAGSEGWMAQTMTFVANATTATLGFLAQGTPTGQPPFVGLDGVSVVAAPEPASIALTGVGVLGLLAVRRTRRKRG